MKKQTAALFELFWENSKLNKRTIEAFRKRLDAYAGRVQEQASLLFPQQDIPIPLPQDALFKTMVQRKSVREFSDKKVSLKTLGSLFAAFAKSLSGNRTFASAGSTYSVEIFAIIHNGEGKVDKKVVYYTPDTHSLTIIGEAPGYKTYQNLINLDTNGTVPAIMFFFTCVPYRTIEKYGERGGRFVLLEAGHAIQNLALRLEHEKMGGVEIGGVFDEAMAALLGIDRYPLQIVLGYACGYKRN